MPRFKGMIHGQNFLIDLGDGPGKTGFYTPIYAEAESPEEAEAVMIAEFRESKKGNMLDEQLLNGENDRPFVRIEDLQECPADENADRKVQFGLAFYPENADEEADD